MKKSILIIGGARSGKSRLAERMALSPQGRAIYIATAEAWDAEMTARIQIHQDRRGAEWDNLHAPRDLCGALRETDGGLPRLVDCLTLWLTNLMMDERDWQAEGRALIETLAAQTAPVLFVTNEVGQGIVPENALARGFRDAQGWLNHQIADACEEMWLVVAGQPIKVKPNDHSF